MPLTPVLSYTLWKDQNNVGGVGGQTPSIFCRRLFRGVALFHSSLGAVYGGRQGMGTLNVPGTGSYLAPLYCTIFATQNS